MIKNIDFSFVIKTTLKLLLWILLFLSVFIIALWFLGIVGKVTDGQDAYEGNSIFISTILNLAKENYVEKLGFALTDTCVFGGILFLVSFILLRAFPKYVKYKSTVLKPSEQNYLQFPQIEKIDDPRVKNNIKRAVKNLSVEMVDMGLFYLGKIFEEQLQAYLLEAQEKNAFEVNRKDLYSTNKMINCLERNGIKLVNSGKYLNAFHFLREERNKRAHGKTPSLEERKKLFREAGFLGDLYLDSIIAIQEHRKSL